MLTNTEKDFYRQFAWALIRKALAILGGFLATHGWISTDQASGLTSQAVIELVAAFLLIAGSAVWSWARVNFSVLSIRVARKSKADTPIAEITETTLEQKNLISSV